MKKIAVYLLLLFGLPTLGSISKHEVVRTVCGIGWIMLVIPWGILMGIDFYRTNDGTSRLSRVFNLVFRVPLAVFGLLCVVAGASILGWVLYNLLVERQKQYTGPRFIIGWGSFGVSVPLMLFGWAMLRSVIRRKDPVVLTAEKEEEFAHEEDDEEHAGPKGSPANPPTRTTPSSKP